MLIRIPPAPLLLIFGLLPWSCTRPEEPVIIATEEVKDITPNSAVSGGYIVYGEETGITERGLVWGISIDPSYERNDGKIILESGDVDFEVGIGELMPETLYYVRAFARNRTGISYGDERSFTTFFSDVTDADGNTYYTIKTGGREWMGKNLSTGRYRDGSIIPEITDSYEWQSAGEGAWSSYNNNPELLSEYGRLYNWHAVVDPRGLCPAGWHVPTDIEWIELEIELGISPSSAIRTGLRDRYAGGKLKETGTKHWLAPNTLATDEIGFSAPCLVVTGILTASSTPSGGI
jgi:uncharacterized protein (TIGR02145 family)